MTHYLDLAQVFAGGPGVDGPMGGVNGLDLGESCKGDLHTKKIGGLTTGILFQACFFSWGLYSSP